MSASQRFNKDICDYVVSCKSILNLFRSEKTYILQFKENLDCFES